MIARAKLISEISA